MVVHLLGYSTFVSKKSNKQCVVLSLGYEDQYFHGLKVESRFVDPSLVSFPLNPGIEIDLGVDLNGRICSLKAVKS